MKNILAALLLLVTFGFANAQDNQTLKNVQAKFKSVKTLEAKFEQYTKTAKGNSGAKTNGTLYYKADEKYRIEFAKQVVVSDGQANYNYMKSSNKLIISGKEDQSESFLVNKFIYEYPKSSKVEDLGGKEVNGVMVKGFRLTPNDKNPKFKTIDVWADSENMIKQIEFQDKSGVYYVVELSDIKTNGNISDSMFTFNQTKDMEVIDLR